MNNNNEQSLNQKVSGGYESDEEKEEVAPTRRFNLAIN